MAADPWFDWPCKKCGHWKQEHPYIPGEMRACACDGCDCTSFEWEECPDCDLEVGQVCESCHWKGKGRRAAPCEECGGSGVVVKSYADDRDCHACLGSGTWEPEDDE